MPDATDPSLPSSGPSSEPSAGTPDFLNHDRPPVPDLVVPQGVQPFHLRNRPVRGRLVRLGELTDALLSRHDNHPAVSRLVGQALALTAGLASALKFRGSFSLQAKSEGAVTMLLADCTESGALRGYAKAEPDRMARLLQGDEDPSAAALLGKGYLAFTCDQGPDMDRYQGIVAIEGITLDEMTGNYFKQSEQIRTMVRLACARTEHGWRAAALIMEKVASAGGIVLGTDDRESDAEVDPEDPDEAWHTACVLAATLTEAEMLDDSIPAPTLLHRLFHAEGLSVDLARALSYGCRCSRARLAGVLGGFGAEDLDHMAEDGAITMNCEFCNVGFRFDRAELGRAAG